ncbi:MAG: hypothetical protein LBH49_04030 [Puniceicoccales bacterium]|jgi:hypothetical protein|nr:hypothetical protein [Puniceicoccales bacterium]
MSNFDPFLCRVNEAGVPHAIPLDSNIYTAPALWFSQSAMCNFYWLLNKITISYSYSFTLDSSPNSPYSIDRTFSMTDDPSLPKYRIIRAPEFAGYNYDASWDISSRASVDLSKIYFNDILGTYGAKIDFKEWSNPEENPVLELALAQRTGDTWASVSYEFMFLDNAITVYLNYLLSDILSGTIDSFGMTAEFFT